MATTKKKKQRTPLPKRRTKTPEEQRGQLGRISAVIVSLALVAIAVVFFGWYPSVPGAGTGVPVRFTFTGEESASQVSDRLYSQGIVKNPAMFAIYYRLRGSWVARGDHVLVDNLTPRQVIDRLQRHGETTKIVIPEGFTRFEIARRMEKQSVCDIRRFLDATTDAALLKELGIDGDSAEGFLFPATYDIPMDSDPSDVVRTLVKTFERRWAHLADVQAPGLRALQDGMGWSRRQIVTLASMVEKEAAKDEERPIIASVFLNRLSDPTFTPKLLQCDPTAAYGCLVSDAPTCLGFTKITHDVLQDAKNPYNTYKHEGLPPGPIASPGAKSIEAVLHPATTKYLYFVAKGGGEHTFSETYAEHEKAIVK